MEHLIGLIAWQLPFACVAFALHGHFLGTAVTFLAFGEPKEAPRNLKNI